MRSFLDLALLIFCLGGTLVLCQDAVEIPEEMEGAMKTPSLSVLVSTTFPAAEIFGIKLVNGKATEALVTFSNEEAEPVSVAFIGGSLWTPDFDPQGSRVVRNLTTARYSVEVAPGEKQSIAYTFTTEMHPQDLRLNIAAVVGDSEGTFYTMQAFNGTVAIVEPDTSIFDPQIIFLYLFITAVVVGVGYFFYDIIVKPYFPQKRRTGGDRGKKSGVAKKVEVAAAEGADGTATTTGAKAYDESWIPAHHMSRPEPKRVKSGTPKPKKAA